MSDDSIESEEDKGPSAPFSLYLAEGENLYKQRNFKKAAEYFSIALVLEPKEKHSLVSRSKCYLQLGNKEAALEDVEAALKEDPEYVKALYQKGEVLYFMNDFEYALVYYYRAQRIHDSVEEYRLGVQKARESIRNAIGDPRLIRLEKRGDLSHFEKQAETLKGHRMSRITPTTIKQPPPSIVKSPVITVKSDKTMKTLLGELYADKKYLENIINNSNLVKHSDHERKEVVQHVENALMYLENRQEFWRQQNPIYARKKSQKMRIRDLQPKRFSTRIICDAIDNIQMALETGEYDKCITIANTILADVKRRFDVRERTDLLCDIYNAMGNAYMEKAQYDEAVGAYQNSLEVAQLHRNERWASLALNNIGKAYALGKHFHKAIETFSKKNPDCESYLESTWLYHEIGRCYFELSNYKQAVEYGLRSLASAEKAESLAWKMHANVLIAQTKANMGDKIASMDKFHLALELARQVHDVQMESAIHRALFESRYTAEKVDGADGTEEGKPRFKFATHLAGLTSKLSPDLLPKDDKSPTSLSQELVSPSEEPEVKSEITILSNYSEKKGSYLSIEDPYSK